MHMAATPSQGASLAGILVALDLRLNNLVGTLPPEMAELKHLSVLLLAGNLVCAAASSRFTSTHFATAFPQARVPAAGQRI